MENAIYIVGMVIIVIAAAVALFWDTRERWRDLRVNRMAYLERRRERDEILDGEALSRLPGVADVPADAGRPLDEVIEANGWDDPKDGG